LSRYGKTYPLGSREAMKREPSLEEEDYLDETIQIILTSEQVSRKSIDYWISNLMQAHSYEYQIEVRPEDVLVTVLVKDWF
jgi:hypothetical protein